jgi:hypothetical protein
MMLEGLNPRQRKEVTEEIKRHLTINLESGKDCLTVRLNWTTHKPDNTEIDEEICTCHLYMDNEDDLEQSI